MEIQKRKSESQGDGTQSDKADPGTCRRNSKGAQSTITKHCVT